jgi:hypothetical protein
VLRRWVVVARIDLRRLLQRLLRLLQRLQWRPRLRLR